MKGDIDTDPPRWSDASEVEVANGDDPAAGLGNCFRAARGRSDWSEGRIESNWQRLRRRLTSLNGDRGERSGSLRRRWAPTWGMVIGGTLLGGAATVLADMAVRNHLGRDLPVATASAPVTTIARMKRTNSRRWRVAVPAAAELEVRLDEDDVGIAVVGGEAELSGTRLDVPLHIKAGESWTEGADTVAAHQADSRSVAREPSPSSLAGRGPSQMVRPQLAYAARSGTASEKRTTMPSAAAATTSVDGRGTESVGAVPPPFPGDPKEGASLATAMRALHADGDPARALQLLDDHERRYATGALLREATLLRAEALLASNRRQEALRVLDVVVLARDHLSRRVALVRAQLRAAHGGCAEAVNDFSLAIATASERPDATDARALYGRAVCRIGRGDIAGGRADLREYLLRHPRAPQRADVERILSGLDSTSP